MTKKDLHDTDVELADQDGVGDPHLPFWWQLTIINLFEQLHEKAQVDPDIKERMFSVLQFLPDHTPEEVGNLFVLSFEATLEYVERHPESYEPIRRSLQNILHNGRMDKLVENIHRLLWDDRGDDAWPRQVRSLVHAMAQGTFDNCDPDDVHDRAMDVYLIRDTNDFGRMDRWIETIVERIYSGDLHFDTARNAFSALAANELRIPTPVNESEDSLLLFSREMMKRKNRRLPHTK